MYPLRCLAVAAAIMAIPCAAPASAQSQSTIHSGQRDPGASDTARDASPAEEIVDNAAKTLQRLKANANFRKLLQDAKGVFVVPGLVTQAVGAGGAVGTGVLMVRRDNGWTLPAFLLLGSISIATRPDAGTGPLVMFLMTDKAADTFGRSNNFSLNAGIGLSVVKFSAAPQRSVGSGDVVVWSGASGLQAGLEIGSSDISADTSSNQSYYGQKVGTKAIFDGKVTGNHPNALLKELPS